MENVNEPREGERLKIMGINEVLELPDPVWQLEGLIERGALVCMFGPSKHGKSFVALDWGLCVATGTAWHGRDVLRGAVIHIAAEGGRGIKKRVRAWFQRNKFATADDAFMILESVTLTDDIEDLIKRIKEKKIVPSLVILDTLARTYSGDENSSADMGRYIQAAQRLQEEFGCGRCTVLIIHHTGKKDTKGARGSSALFAAVDAMISVNKDGNGIVRVTNEKQKDDAEFKAIHLKLTPISIGSSSEGDPITSCVLEPASVLARIADAKPLPVKRRQALVALQGLDEAQTGEWCKATVLRLHEDVPEDTFNKWRRTLVEDGYVEADNSIPARYRLTDKGASAIGAPSSANDTEPASVSHVTHPVGVTGQAVDDARKAA